MFDAFLSRLKHWLAPSDQPAIFPPLNFFKMKTETIYCEVKITGTPLIPYFQDPSTDGKWVQGQPKPDAPGVFFGVIEHPAPGTYAILQMCLGEPGATNTVTYLYQKDPVVIAEPLVVDFYLAKVVEVATPDALPTAPAAGPTTPAAPPVATGDTPTAPPAATEAAYITALPS